jgi:hypothetical protein
MKYRLTLHSTQFLQLVLDHGSLHKEPPTFDILSRYAFASDPNTSFASLIFQRLQRMGNPLNPMQLLVDFSQLILDMWSRCHDEQLTRPIYDLVSLLSFTLQLHSMSVAPHIIHDLLPIAQASIHIIAQPRRKSPLGDLTNDPALAMLQSHIETSRILSVLYITAAACASSSIKAQNGTDTRIVEFWKMMNIDTVVLLLGPKQPLGDIITTLDLLCTSSIPASIGPILEDKPPDLVARLIIEKVSINLTDTPRWAESAAQKCRIRLAALKTLTAFCRHQLGAIQMAMHSNLIPRLVTVLSSTIDDLYDVQDLDLGSEEHQDETSLVGSSLFPDAVQSNLDVSSAEANAAQDVAELLGIISQTTLLLHALVTDPRTANLANINAKLSVSHGGSQRYLVALSRLTFAEEELIFEAGISTATVDLAHELLELAVTPDEGDAIREAFGD